MPWTFDSTSRTNAAGNRTSVVTLGAANTAATARPSAAANAMARRERPRSSNGASSGPATATGAMVSPRYSATFSRACPTGSEKNTELAKATATMASPATLAMCTSEYRSSGSGEPYMRRSGRAARSSSPANHSRTSAARSRARCPAECFGSREAEPEDPGSGDGAEDRDERPGGLLTSSVLRGGEAFAQEVPGHLWVGRAPGLLHQLSHQELQRALLAAAKLHDRVGVLRPDLPDQRAEGVRIGDLPNLEPLHDVVDVAAG